MESLDDAVRERVFELLEGSLSLEAFEDWFVGETWDDRTPLVAQIDHALAEKEILSADQLREALATAVSTITSIRHQFSTATTTQRMHGVRIGGNATINRRFEFAGR